MMPSGNDRKYSLWLLPAQNAGKVIQEHIDEIAREHGLFTFKAHLTLAGKLFHTETKLIETCLDLARSNTGFRVYLSDIGMETAFYRSFYLKIEKTPYLMELREKAMRKFGLKEESYQPHISLAYGLQDEFIKSDLSNSILKRLPFEYFDIKRLSLVETSGKPPDWKELKILNLR